MKLKIILKNLVEITHSVCLKTYKEVIANKGKITKYLKRSDFEMQMQVKSNNNFNETL